MKINTKIYEEKMNKTIAAYESNLAVIRAGQANPMVLAKVTFEYYGAPTLINTMADIRVADAKTIVITPYDKSTLKAMEKAILHITIHTSMAQYSANTILVVIVVRFIIQSRL